MEDLNFYDNDTNKFITEEIIRKIDFELNIEDLGKNFNNIVDGIININHIIKHITDSLYADIKDVIKDLNECWGYNIDILKKIKN